MSLQNTEFLFLPYQFSGPQRNPSAYALFTALQTLVDLAYTQVSPPARTLLQMVTGEKLLITDDLGPACLRNISVCLPKWVMMQQEMPYPAYFSNNLALLLGFIMPLFLVLSFAFIVPPILKRIVYEKETGVKELMKMMGLPSWMHWVGFFGKFC